MLRHAGWLGLPVLIAGLVFAQVDPGQGGPNDESSQGRHSKGGRAGLPDAEDVFERIDRDDDGSISPEEFRKAHRRFRAMARRFREHRGRERGPDRRAHGRRRGGDRKFHGRRGRDGSKDGRHFGRGDRHDWWQKRRHGERRHHWDPRRGGPQVHYHYHYYGRKRPNRDHRDGHHRDGHHKDGHHKDRKDRKGGRDEQDKDGTSKNAGAAASRANQPPAVAVKPEQSGDAAARRAEPQAAVAELGITETAGEAEPALAD